MKLSQVQIALCLTFLISACLPKGEEEYLKEATTHIQQNNLDEAIISLKNVLISSPDNHEARFNLANIYYSQGRFNSAEKEYQKLLSANYDSETIYANLAKVNNLQNNYESTLELQNNQWQQEPLHAAFVFQKMLAHYRLNEPDAAEPLLKQLEKRFATTFYGRLGTIYGALNKDIKKANTELDALLSEYPQESDAWLLKGLISNALGQHETAANAFAKHLEILPNYDQIRLYYADALVKAKDFESAAREIKVLNKIANKNAFVQQLNGLVKFNDNNYQDAQRFFEFALQNGLDSTSNRLLAGLSAFQNQRFEAAHQYLTSIESKLAPSHPARKVLAITQLELGYSVDASDNLKTLDDISNFDASLLTTASYELLKSGHINKAQALIKKVEDTQELNSENLIRLGTLKLNMDDLDGLVNLEKALNIDPDLPVAKVALATAYIQTEQYDKALELAQDWQSNGDITGFNIEGLIYHQQGNDQKAEIAFQKALDIDPKNSQSMLFFAIKAIKQKEYKLASNFLEKLLTSEPDNLGAIKKYYFVSMKLNDSQKAIAFMENRFNENPQSETHRMQLAQLYVADKKPNQVIRVLTSGNFKPSKETNDFYWFALADSLESVNKSREALKVLNDLNSTKPSTKAAWVKSAVLAEKLGQLPQALSIVERGLRFHNGDLGLISVETSLLIKNKRYDKAKQNIEQYFSNGTSGKNNSVAQFLEGQLNLFQFKFEQSLPLLTEYYIKNKSSEVARYLFINYMGLKQTEKAVTFLEAHIDEVKNDVPNMVLLANHLLNDNHKKATAIYQNILKVMPTNLMSLNNLAWLQLQQNNLSAAKSTITNALDIYSEHPSILDTAATVYEKLGEESEAKRLIKKARDLAPTNSNINKNYQRIMKL